MHVRRSNFIWSFRPKIASLPSDRAGKWIVEAAASAFFERFQDLDDLVEAGKVHHMRYTHPRAYHEEFRARPFLAAYCLEADKDRVRQILVDMGLSPKEWRGAGTAPGFFEREEELGEELERRNPPEDAVTVEGKPEGSRTA